MLPVLNVHKIHLNVNFQNDIKFKLMKFLQKLLNISLVFIRERILGYLN